MVDMYMKLGAVEDGRRLFDLMPLKNIVTWSSLLTGYSQNGHENLVLEMFSRMRGLGFKPNAYTCTSLITASSCLQDMDSGIRAHGLVIKLGFEPATFVCNSLVSMYSKLGLILLAMKLFDEMPLRNSVSWNAIIAGLVHNEMDKEAILMFLQMGEQGWELTQSSFAAAAKACGGACEVSLLGQLHCCITKKGFTSDVTIRTALMGSYCKLTQMDEAFRLFSSIGSTRNIISWTAIISGYLINGNPGQASAIFLQMRRQGDARSNEFTFSAILTSPMISPSQVHADAIKTGCENFNSVGTALIKSYSDPNSAFQVFSGIKNKDLVSWSAMITAFAQAGDSISAVKLFSEMTTLGEYPNEFTLSSLIHSCAAPSASTDQGKQFHASSIKLGVDEGACVSTALITMYAKKGAIESASYIFAHLQDRDLVSWNSMLCGWALHGRAHESLQLFEEMQQQGLDPDDITFFGLLTACTHAGLIREGRDFFDSIIAPTEEHYACMVDLYSRAGHFDEAMSMVKLSPYPFGASVWRTLLSNCRNHKNLELGILAAEKVISIEPGHSAGYVLLSNMYAQMGLWAERTLTRRRMEVNGVKKEAGRSWVDVKNKVVSFVSGDESHSFSGEVYDKLQELLCKLKAVGYTADTGAVLQDLEEEEQKETILGHHSEKLALAFGLLVVPKTKILQIVKNLRVCSDCHVAFKLTSTVEGRSIVLRDSSRFHHFENGLCSCRDYW